MPSADAQKRPGLPHRHSAGSVSFAKSPHDAPLSSSASKQKTTRFVVGQTRLANRNSSYGKNLNKLSKLTPARAPEPDTPTSPRPGPGHVKHNSSNIQLDRSQSATVLRKNHSETSLKKNRSSGHLTKLARPSSSRNVAAKALRTRQKRSRSSASNIQPPDGPANPTVRFDLGGQADEYDDDEANEEEGQDDDEGSWAYTDSRSPSTTRSSTRRNSLIASPNPKSPRDQGKENLDPTDRPPSAAAARTTPSSEPLSPSRLSSNASSARSHEADSITSRLLKRNVSFNIAPQVTSNPAHPVLIDPRDPVAHSHNTLNDSSNPEVVSRFLAQGTSTSGPSHESSFLPRHPASADDSAPAAAAARPSTPSSGSPAKPAPSAAADANAPVGPPRRNKSLPSMSDEYVSRTQQRLNLERESADAAAAPAAAPPRTLMHVSRLSSASVPFAPGGLAAHARTLADRAAVEYRRVRLYQNPLADAARRAARHPAPAPRPASRRAPQRRRPRVMFQGVNDGAGDDDGAGGAGRVPSRGSVDDEAGTRRARRDALREMCERLWAADVTAGAAGAGGD